MIYLEIIIAYFVFVWVILRLTVPYLGFSRAPIPETLPRELTETIADINRNSKTDLEFLQKAYGYVTRTYTGGRLETIYIFWRAFGDIYTKSPGFLPCTGQTHLVRTFLIKSGRFSENDIEIKTVPLNLFIHQYLRVRVGNEWIYVDPWANFLGVPFGKKKAFIG